MDYKDYTAGATKDFFYHKARTELIALLLHKAGKGKGLKILEMGAGCGDDLIVVSQFGDVYAVDIDSKALELIPPSLVFEKRIGDICHLPYEDNSFDLVLAFDVLEHIEDDNLAVNEIYRLLKPNGFFIFTVPAFNLLYSSHDKALNHFRRYDKTMLKKHLLHFRCMKLGYWVFLLFPIVAIQRILTRKNSKPGVHYPKLPSLANNLLYLLLKLDNWFIKHDISLPFGLTIYGIYQK